MPRISALPDGDLQLSMEEGDSFEGDVPMPPRRGHADDGDSGEEDAYREGPIEEKKFRFNARNAFLTYPRCDIRPQQYLRHTTFDRRDIKHAFGKQERHVDGERHLHVWITFIRKMDTNNPRFFDLVVPPTEDHPGATFHCNIRRGERKRAGGISNHVRAYEYLCKYDGAVPVDIVGASNLYPTSRNFRKEHGDRTEWLNYLTIRAMPNPSYPLTLPNGDEVPEPNPADKRRHLWIYGPPNAGKTKWLEANIYRFKNFKVAGTLYPYDNYNGEQIIVYDDIVPDPQHLLNITNSSDYPRPVPGQTRYSVRYVPGGLVTLVVVCMNEPIDVVYEKQRDTTRDALKTRFVEHQILVELADE